MSGFQWAGGWWSFAERGVGMLTWQMERALSKDAGARLRLATDVRRVEDTGTGIRIAAESGGRLIQEDFDGVVMAVPGNMVPVLMPGLPEAERRFFEQVTYVGHHIMNMVVRPNGADLPMKQLLPTADGFGIMSNVSMKPRGDGLWDVYGEMKGAFCAETAGASSEAILDRAWAEILLAMPGVAPVEIVDRRLQRNDIAIARRPVGYVTALKAFRDLPPNPRIAYAGDYLLNSTVGQAHWTGLKAAEQLTAGSHSPP